MNNSSDNYSFSCPHCGQILEAESGMGGLKCPCPGCGETIVVPKPTPISITVVEKRKGLFKRNIKTVAAAFCVAVVIAVVCVFADDSTQKNIHSSRDSSSTTSTTKYNQTRSKRLTFSQQRTVKCIASLWATCEVLAMKTSSKELSKPRSLSEIDSEITASMFIAVGETENVPVPGWDDLPIEFQKAFRAWYQSLGKLKISEKVEKYGRDAVLGALSRWKSESESDVEIHCTIPFEGEKETIENEFNDAKYQLTALCSEYGIDLEEMVKETTETISNW